MPHYVDTWLMKIEQYKTQAALLTILARYLGVDPSAVAFEDKKGKPQLKQSDLQFSVSHSGEYAVIAVSKKIPVGVDIEYTKRSVDFQAIAKRFFAPGEYEALNHLTSASKIEAFYRCWTRKEAFVKADGAGLSYPLSDFEVAVDPHSQEKSLLKSIKNDKKNAIQWILLDLPDLPMHYCGAIAARVGNAKITLEVRSKYYPEDF